MVDWFLETGVYLLGAVLVSIVGVLSVCAGLWADRSQGSPRCPQCGCDMRGSLPSLVCPECGHDAVRERRLHLTRRHWRLVVVGVLLLLPLAYPLSTLVGWCCEQPSIQKLAVAVRTRSGGPGGPHPDPVVAKCLEAEANCDYETLDETMMSSWDTGVERTATAEERSDILSQTPMTWSVISVRIYGAHRAVVRTGWQRGHMGQGLFVYVYKGTDGKWRFMGSVEWIS